MKVRGWGQRAGSVGQGIRRKEKQSLSRFCLPSFFFHVKLHLHIRLRTDTGEFTPRTVFDAHLQALSSLGLGRTDRHKPPIPGKWERAVSHFHANLKKGGYTTKL